MPFPRHLLLSLTTCSLLLSQAAPVVGRPLAQKPGFGADLAITTAVIQQTSQFNADDDNEITPDLNNSGQKVSDATNPIFDSRQHDNRYSLFALYNYLQPFGWKNWSIIGLGFISQTGSNISFYEKESAGLSLGVGYRWR